MTRGLRIRAGTYGTAQWRRLAAVRSAGAGEPLRARRALGAPARAFPQEGGQQNVNKTPAASSGAHGAPAGLGPGAAPAGSCGPVPLPSPRPGRRKRSQGGSGPPPAGAARRGRGGAGLGWGSSTGRATSPRSPGPLCREQIAHLGPATVTQPSSLHRAEREPILASGPPANRRTTRVD